MFKKAKEALLFGFSDNLIDGEDFDLNDISEDDCISEFRFQKNDIRRLKNVLQIPD